MAPALFAVSDDPVVDVLLVPQASESIIKVAETLSSQQIETYFIPLLKRLSSGEWFTSRTSSAVLYAPVYSKVSPSIKDDLRRDFSVLAVDETPMVRRASAKALGVCFLVYKSPGLHGIELV